MNFVSDARKKCTHKRCNKEIRNKKSYKYIYDFFSDTFLIFIFYSAITYGDVSYDYIPEIFAALEEQRNNFALDKEKKKYV